MTRECHSIRSVRKFATESAASEDDARLASQVEMWSTMNTILETFGFDVNTPISPKSAPSLRRFMISLDTWRADWSEQFGQHGRVGNYPRKGVKLHFHFAKLYLCSHAFRGIDSNIPPELQESIDQLGTSNSGMSYQPVESVTRSSSDGGANPSRGHGDLEEIAAAAVESAQSILRIIITDAEMQAHLNGLPLYFDTMIAFAIVFLYKVATRYSFFIHTDSGRILDLVRGVANTLKEITANMHRQHLLVAFSSAIDRLGYGNRQAATVPDIQAVEQNRLHDNLQGGVGVNQDSGHPHAGLPINEATDVSNVWDLSYFDWTAYDLLGAEDMPMDMILEYGTEA